ncbi:hypothetical protein EWB00_006599 [Schistosoma japonicum]|uniref:Uncharacterized protein n=1 Tax=Schistosoma japonicum TaxID=6182 RepID=A0A4Z2CXN5_SCHJA|nr:hypothetical protein EWB00_006599 [Schistosoma japonicum]
MFPKGIQFTNKPWSFAVEALQQIRNHHPTIISLSDVHDVQGLTKLWKSFITDVKATMTQPSTAYKLMHEFLDVSHISYQVSNFQTHFVEADIDFYTCLSSLLSANLFKRYDELDTFTLGLLISVIKEKCDHMVVRRIFPYLYGPVLSLKLTISENDDHIVTQMELINQLEQLTNFWLAYLSNEFPDVSKFDPVHFLFDWIRLAYCLIIIGIIGGKMNYFSVGVQFLFVIKSKNLQQYTNFTKYILEELWDSLRSIYYRARDLSSNSSLSGNEHLSNPDPQSPTEQDFIDSYYQEFSLLLKLCRLTSNLNCSTYHKIDNQTLDKLTCLIFDRLATLCFYQCGITVHNHLSIYHALFGEEQSLSVNNWSEFLLKPLINLT